MEQLTNLESKQMRKPQKALNRNNQIYKNNQCLNKTPCFNNSFERRQ